MRAVWNSNAAFVNHFYLQIVSDVSPLRYKSMRRAEEEGMCGRDRGDEAEHHGPREGSTLARRFAAAGVLPFLEVSGGGARARRSSCVELRRRGFGGDGSPFSHQKLCFRESLWSVVVQTAAQFAQMLRSIHAHIITRGSQNRYALSPFFHWRKPPTSDRSRGRERRGTRTSRPAASSTWTRPGTLFRSTVTNASCPRRLREPS